MSEPQVTPERIRLETGQPGLELVQMLTSEDDKAYFDLQNSNLDYWKEFGNAIDETEEVVTARRLENGNNRFGIWHDGELIGMVGISTKQSKNEAEIGILLAKQASGYGYATSAVKTLTAYAKQRFNRVYAEVAPDNTKSIELLQRANFHSTGEMATRDWGEALVFEA